MKYLAVISLALLLGSVSLLRAQESTIDPGRFQLEATDGAVANSSVNKDGPNNLPAVTAVVSKTGLEFWSVELRAQDIAFDSGKTYEINFQAKSVPARYIYIVPEKASGNQSSVADGMILHLSDQWAQFTVQFNTTDQATPGRLTLSSLSTSPASFSFSDFHIRTK